MTNTGTVEKKKKSLANWAITIAAWGIGFVSVREAVVFIRDELARREVNLEVNKDLPKKINERMTLDRIEIDRKATTYSYSTNMTQAQMAEDTTAEASIRADVCSNANMAKHIRNGLTYFYRYNDRDGLLGRVITVSNCS